jgi:hypothetical protein
MAARTSLDDIRHKLVELHSSRFARLPVDCGRDRDPGVLEPEGWQDWTSKHTTPDQLRIEAYLGRFDLSDKSILHVGIGNSGFATRFATRARRIVGTSIVPAEVEHGASLGLRNYRTVLHNKYSGRDSAVRGTFDFIVDNNPTGYCCCLSHFAAALHFYAARLAPDGQLLTDRRGLAWTPDSEGRNRRWEFSFADFAAAARCVGLGAYRMSGDIFALAPGRPEAPPGHVRLQALIKSAFERAAGRAARLAGAR